jgi:predicted dienelactone hydrolase
MYRFGLILASNCLWLGLACANSPGAYPGELPARAVSFEEITIPYLDEPALRGGAWYPTLSRHNSSLRREPRVDGDHLPLVVISHGGGGSYDGHEDTALALARAGFVVAAVNHAGDTYDDQDRVLELWRRPDQLHRLITFMLTAWHSHDRIDLNRVGAFGFSNGAFTVLVAAGGIPDLDRTASYCRSHPDHDLCAALATAKVSPFLGTRAGGTGPWTHDRRIRAIAVAAPAFGFSFSKDGLREVTIPVQLWGGALDDHQPVPWYEDAVARDLPLPPEFHRVRDANHFDFLPPCNATLARVAPAICVSAPGFDRAAFHRRLNTTVVDFFSRHLGGRSS